MIRYPMTFDVQSEAQPGIQSTWKAGPHSTNQDLDAFTVAIPPEFEGPGGGYSPEDFYALALANCFIATFKVFAEKSKISFSSLVGEGKLTVDRDDKSAPWMKSFHLKVSLFGVVDPERTLRLLEKTASSCMILNSVKTEKTFEFNLNH